MAFFPLRARVFVASAVPQRRVFAASAAVFAASATQVKVSFVQSKPSSGKTTEPWAQGGGECAALPSSLRASTGQNQGFSSAERFLKDLLAASRSVSFLASTPKAFAFEGLFWLENGILEYVFQ